MAEKSLLLQLVGELPLFKIMDFLIDNKGIDFTKEQIADGAGLSRASVFSYWHELEMRGIVRATRKEGKTSYCTLHSVNPTIQKILDLEVALISQAMDAVAQEKVLEV